MPVVIVLQQLCAAGGSRAFSPHIGPIVLVVRVWATLLSNSRILFMCVNMSVVYAINSQTSKDENIMKVTRELVVTCMIYNIQFCI